MAQLAPADQNEALGAHHDRGRKVWPSLCNAVPAPPAALLAYKAKGLTGICGRGKLGVSAE